LLQAGIGPNVDMIGYHMYETPPEATAAAISNVRLVMASHGVGSMRLWDTEGASGDTTTPDDLAAAYLVRKYLVDLAFGSIRYDWYAWGKATSFCVGTEENDPRMLTAAGRAFGILVTWLQGAWLTGASIDASGTWQIELSWPQGGSLTAEAEDDLPVASGARWRAARRPGGSHGVIVWNPNSDVAFAIPGSMHAVTQYDIFGNAAPVTGISVKVGSSPVLLKSAYGGARAVQ